MSSQFDGGCSIGNRAPTEQGVCLWLMKEALLCGDYWERCVFVADEGSPTLWRLLGKHTKRKRPDCVSGI